MALCSFALCFSSSFWFQLVHFHWRYYHCQKRGLRLLKADLSLVNVHPWKLRLMAVLLLSSSLYAQMERSFKLVETFHLESSYLIPYQTCEESFWWIDGLSEVYLCHFRFREIGLTICDHSALSILTIFHQLDQITISVLLVVESKVERFI